MTFLTPTLALVAAAIAVPSLIILYFLKLRRRDVEISSTILWKKAIQDLQANAPFQKLRRNILLILQLLALAAALFALAQPQIRSGQSPGQRHVILIDRSASMTATDGDPAGVGRLTRLEAAKRDAIALVDSLREPDYFGEGGDQAMVVAFDSSAVVLAQLTGSKPELRRVIQSITPSDAPTSIREAIRLARAQAARKTFTDDKTGNTVDVGGASVGTIHIFSDGRLPDLLAPARLDSAGKKAEDMITPEDVVVYHPVGRPQAWNVAITGLRAERAFDDPAKLSVFVGVQSTARKPITAEITLAVEGRVAAVRDVNIPAASALVPGAADVEAAAGGSPPPPGPVAPGVGGLVFTIERPAGGVLTLQMRVPESAIDADGPVLASDDTGYLVVPPAKRLAIAMVTDGNLFLSEVLEGMTLARPLRTVPTAAAQKFIESRDAAEYDAIILDRWLPTLPGPDGKPAPSLPPGRFLVVGSAVPPPLGLTDQGEGGPTLVMDWRRDHPVLRNLSLDSVVVRASRKLEVPPDSPAVPLALGEQGPLVFESSDTGRRVIGVTFDLMESTWGFDPASFVVFVVRSLEYLAGTLTLADPTSSTLRPGQTLSTQLPGGAEGTRVILPDESAQPLTMGPAGEVNFAPLDRVGIYTVEWQGPAGASDVADGPRARRAVAVNLLDPDESDVAAKPSIELPTNARIITSAAGEGVTSLWPWLLLLVIAIILVEWWVYNRKVSL